MLRLVVPSPWLPLASCVLGSNWLFSYQSHKHNHGQLKGLFERSIHAAQDKEGGGGAEAAVEAYGWNEWKLEKIWRGNKVFTSIYRLPTR